MGNVKETQVVEKTHIFCSKTIFLKNRVIYEVMWKTKEELRGHT
jgi:hypothetical protein